MKFLSILALIAPIALALPTSVITEAPVEDAALESRQSCYAKCGSTCYTSAQVTAARNSGYNYVKQGGTAGGSTYPHVFNNREGFDFLVGGTYYEFPIKTGGVYTGGMYLDIGLGGIGLMIWQAPRVLTVLCSTAVDSVLARLRTLVPAATTSLPARDGRCCEAGSWACGFVVLELQRGKSIDEFYDC